jgi:hypothetical protein
MNSMISSIDVIDRLKSHHRKRTEQEISAANIKAEPPRLTFRIPAARPDAHPGGHDTDKNDDSRCCPAAYVN